MRQTAAGSMNCERIGSRRRRAGSGDTQRRSARPGYRSRSESTGRPWRQATYGERYGAGESIERGYRYCIAGAITHGYSLRTRHS